MVYRRLNAFPVAMKEENRSIEMRGDYFSAAPLAFQAERMRRITSSTPTPFLIWQNNVGPPSLI